MSLFSNDKMRLIVKFGASAISLYAVYNIYKIITTPTVTKTVEVGEKEKAAESSGCGQGEACCQTKEKPVENSGCGQGQESCCQTKGNAISCGTKSDRQKDKDGDCCGQDDCNKPTDEEQHVFGGERPQWNGTSDEEDDEEDAFSIAGSQDGPLLDIEDLGSAAVAQMDDDEGSQDSGVTIHKKNEDMIEKFKNHKEMVDDTGESSHTNRSFVIEILISFLLGTKLSSLAVGLNYQNE